MSNQKVSQQLFFKVKQKLDYHRLPVNFPIEAAPLLDKLLGMINHHSHGPHHHSKQGVLEGENSIPGALKHQIARVVKENNQLHINLMQAKEQIQSLQHRVYKLQANKHSEEIQLQQYSGMKGKRQQQLINELREVKYKYNELMDFLHQDPKADRQYIKRLMKHKKLDVQQGNFGEIHQAKNKNTHGSSSDRIKQLQAKVLNRENEILRLQKLVQYDGISMNKLIKNFNQQLAKKQLKNADSKINYLQSSYEKIKKENSKMKGNNGSKEALRAEVQKCHSLIKSLKAQNKDLKRNAKQKQFDINKQTEQNHRNIKKAQAEKSHADKVIANNNETIRDLYKKAQFLQKELGQAKSAYQGANNNILRIENDKGNLLKKHQETKVFYQYEIDSLKKRIIQLQIQLQQSRIKGNEILKQLQITTKQGHLKSDSIANLQKIVNQLIRKNSILADHTVGTLQESLKRSQDLQLKRQLIEREQHFIHSQNQRAELEVNLKTLQHRFGQVVKQNERFKFQNGQLRDQISSRQILNAKLAHQIDEIKFALKRQQNEHARSISHSNEQISQKISLLSQLRAENQRLNHQQKSLKLRVKDLQIKISQQEGVWQVTRIRLEQKEVRIKQLQKLLSDSLQHKKVLSGQLSELEHKSHELSREKHRLAKKYQQLRKDDDQFKATSYKNYEVAINDNLNQLAAHKKQIAKLSQSNNHLSIRYEEVSNLINIIRREKELIQFDKLGLERENDILKSRLLQMQEIQRSLVIDNENLHALARRM